MSLKPVQLDQLTLVYAVEHLRLSVSSIADIRLPAGLASLDGDEITQALTTGSVWTARGKSCRLELQLSLDGKPLEVPNNLKIIESLGYHLRDAHLWSQLSLSTSLNIPPQGLEKQPADIVLSLNHGSSLAITKAMPRGWLLDNVEVNPPDAVLCAGFERLRLQLDLGTENKRGRPSNKRTRSNLGTQDMPEIMLFDQPPGEDTHLEALEDVVDQLSQTLVKSVAACFPASIGDNQHSEQHSVPVKRGGTRLHKDALLRLTAWFGDHSNNPYPTKEEKQQLPEDTGLTPAQIKTWFSHQRRLRNQDGSGDEDMLLASGGTQWDPRTLLIGNEDDEMISLFLLEECPDDKGKCDRVDDDMLLCQPMPSNPGSDSMEHHEFDELLLQSEDYHVPMVIVEDTEDQMLLSRCTDTPPSLISNVPTISSESTASNSSRKRSKKCLTGAESPVIIPSASSICNLVQAAILIVITGHWSRGPKIPVGISIAKPPLTNTLSALAPSIFSPGYKELIAHNSKFLPTIFNAMSSSLIKNVQGAGLRKKLFQLSKVEVSGLSADGQKPDGATGSVESCSSVIQGKVWSMMQRTLFDPSSARRLRWTDVDGGTEGSDDVESSDDLNLLQEHDCRDVQNLAEDIGIFPDDRMDEGEELLLRDLWTSDNDGSGLLDSLEEAEQRAVEMETDEMLFGNSGEHFSIEYEGFLIEECMDLNEIMLL